MNVIMMSDKVAVETKRINIVEYSIECPLCKNSRIYRFDTNLKSGVKCKYCKEYFAVKYFSKEEDMFYGDEPLKLIQCEDCKDISDVRDLKEDKCNCGSDRIKRLTIII